jgi:hypothetical protein
VIAIFDASRSRPLESESAAWGEIANGESPCQLLEMPLLDGAIPAIGDYTTVFWLLHLKLGDEIEIDGARLRIVGLLDKSIFQSELLISEANFKRAFPDQGGWRMFAVDAPPERAEAASAWLVLRGPIVPVLKEDR